MTDNATKKAARKLQRESGISYTRALGQVTGQQTTDLAGTLSLDMLQKLLKTEPGPGLEIAKLWQEHELPRGTDEPVVMDHLLRVPIGLATDGHPVFLDLKEQADGGHGPHGLIIGRTGSGKTNALQTIALGLLTQHSPRVVRALIIDAKGSDTFDALADWPHVQRLVAPDPKQGQSPLGQSGDLLRAILHKRRNELAEAGRQIRGAPFSSLREYNAARATRSGATLPAIPFILVFADEFPILLRQEPALRGGFDAVARYGNQLGLFLLLGSQIGAAETAPPEWEISYRIDLNATGGEPRGAAHFTSSPDAEPVKYQGFHVPQTTLRAVELRMPGHPAAGNEANLSVERLQKLLKTAPGSGLDIAKL